MSTTRRTALAMTGAGLAAALTDFAAHAAKPMPQPCPLADAIEAYRKGCADFAAIPDDALTMESEPAFVEATYGPAMDRLISAAPAAASLIGVAEAIRLTFTEEALIDANARGILKSALAYLDARIARGEG